jgi:hypothetical protein
VGGNARLVVSVLSCRKKMAFESVLMFFPGLRQQESENLA